MIELFLFLLATATVVAWWQLMQGRQKARMAATQVCGNHGLQLLDDTVPTIGLQNYRAAIDLALVYQRTGEWEKANDLLDQCQDFIRERPRLGSGGGYWVSDVSILALKGEKTEALTALRHGVDEGWRSLWWYYLRHDPNLDSIRGEPEFQRIVSEIEADMSAQMQQIREMEKRGEIAAVPGIVFNSD